LKMRGSPALVGGLILLSRLKQLTELRCDAILNKMGDVLRMKRNAAALIRIVTAAPIVSMALLLVLFLAVPQLFHGVGSFLMAVLFIVIVPLAAYPLQKHLKNFKNKGREGQRNLAIVTAGAGYALGTAAALIAREDRGMMLIYLTYFVSWLILVLLNKAIHIRASGHACGTAGPLAVGAHFFGIWAALIGVVILALVYWSSLKLKRHTPRELACGTLVPAVSLAIAVMIIKMT